jgi:hypothetical protein
MAQPTVNLFPIPTDTPISDSGGRQGMFGSIWLRFWKSISDKQISENIVSNLPSNIAFKFVLVGTVCTCNWYVTTEPASDTQIILPYTSLLAFEANGVVYPPKTTSITIPKAVTFSQFDYVASPTK